MEITLDEGMHQEVSNRFKNGVRFYQRVTHLLWDKSMQQEVKLILQSYYIPIVT